MKMLNYKAFLFIGQQPLNYDHGCSITQFQ